MATDLFSNESKFIILSNEQVKTVQNDKGESFRISSVDVDPQVFKLWKSNIQLIHSNSQFRLDWINHIKQCMSKTVMGEKKKNGQNIVSDDFLNSVKIINDDEEGIIGSGSYGTVFRGILTPKGCSYVPVVVKIEYFQKQEEINKFEKECGQYANEIQLKRQSMHFPFLIDQFVTQGYRLGHQGLYYIVYTIMEYSEGDLDQLIDNNNLSTPELFNIYGQIVFTLLEMGLNYQMVHWDLYFRNILYNLSKSNQLISFQTCHSTNCSKKMIYSFYPTNIIVKIADFGFCSTKSDREDLKLMQQFNYVGWNQLSQMDVVQFKNLPRYARDILSITESFYQLSLLKTQWVTLQSYFARVLGYITHQIEDDPDYLQTPEELNELIQFIFSDKFTGPSKGKLGLTTTEKQSGIQGKLKGLVSSFTSSKYNPSFVTNTFTV